MKKIQAILTGIVLTIGTLFLAPSISATTDTVQSCSQSYYNVYEFTGFSGDGLHVCYPVNFTDLSQVMHLQAGTCYTSAGLKDHDDWDNCLSSVKVVPDSEAHSVCFYTGYVYAGNFTRVVAGQNINFQAPMNDTISSIRWC